MAQSDRTMHSDRHPQDDLLIVEALVQYTASIQDADTDRADRAEELAVSIAAMHGLGLDDALDQIDYDWGRPFLAAEVDAGDGELKHDCDSVGDRES